MNAVNGETGYPVIQLITLAETGTRALLGAVFESTADGEITWARHLLHMLDELMLVLLDRGFDAADFLFAAGDEVYGGRELRRSILPAPA